MKRIVTHLLVAAGLAAGACGVAQAHTDLNIGLSLGAPAPVYAAPQPVYYGYGGWGHRDDRGGYYRNDHRYDRGWNHDDHRGGHDDHGDRRGGWHG
ncbi:PXPV repeat protein [Paraburkholderia sp. BCC1884]|uniref:PXPV repeat protein n=1 Tax=Paraburkholderia sp. BCC1884 TaxID=2562668 RepID=UPI001181CF04|nr:PXPV repeat protein [Paraburkholderia sp. BCC1884]